ncbi:MAG TPA: hypothetical protein VN923_01925 [Thermoanaerobaculia bacterium]|nr:hypothetical protein [Thermoanaerobaculia bacterium]
MSRKIAACLGLWLVATAALAAERVTGDAAANVVKKYRGDWGCFFEAPQSQFGPIRGLELITIDRAGNVVGEESVAYNDPFLEAQTTFAGQLAAQDNGTLAGQLILHVVSPPGIPDVPFDIICEGVSPQGDRYNEMRCLDVFPQQDGSKVIGILQCKQR